MATLTKEKDLLNSVQDSFSWMLFLLFGEELFTFCGLKEKDPLLLNGKIQLNNLKAKL